MEVLNRGNSLGNDLPCPLYMGICGAYQRSHLSQKVIPTGSVGPLIKSELRLQYRLNACAKILRCRQRTVEDGGPYSDYGALLVHLLKFSLLRCSARYCFDPVLLVLLSFLELLRRGSQFL